MRRKNNDWMGHMSFNYSGTKAELAEISERLAQLRGSL